MTQRTTHAGVVASGRGTRLGSGQRSKALVSVGGRPLIEHVLTQLRRTGVEQLVVSIRPGDTSLQEYLTSTAVRWFQALRIVYVPAEAGSGGATRAVARAIGPRPHLLCTADVVGPEHLARDVARAGECEGEQIMCRLLAAPLQWDTKPAWVSVGRQQEVISFGRDSSPSPLVYGNIRWMSAAGAAAFAALPCFPSAQRDAHLMRAFVSAFPRATLVHTTPVVFDVDDKVDVAMAEDWLAGRPTAWPIPELPRQVNLLNGSHNADLGPVVRHTV